MTTYDLSQQLYCLNAAANAVGQKQEDEQSLETAMNIALNTYIPQLTGNWKVTWGPRVFKSKPNVTTSGPENAWFAAEDADQKICVIAVAGTSGSSIKAWFTDFDVTKVVDFTAWSKSWPSKGIQPPPPSPFPPPSGKAYAARGTCTGVYNILSHKSRLASNGQLLGDYIVKSVVPAGYKVIFTGHSLGGAVAPTAALGLLNAGMCQPGNTFILPSAGASPGNQELTSAFTFAFPAGPLPPGPVPVPSPPHMNTDLYNSFDVVPQAWSLDPSSGRYLANINNIYSNAGPLMKALIKNVLVDPAVALSKASGISYEPINGTGFTGEPPIPSVHSWAELTTQVLRHHMGAYWEMLNIQDWVKNFSKKLDEYPGVEELQLQLEEPVQAEEGEAQS